MKELNGSQMIMEALHEEGVEVVFGYPGGAALNIYDETYKQKYFRHIGSPRTSRYARRRRLREG